MGANYMTQPLYNDMPAGAADPQNMDHLKTPGMAWNQMAAMGY